MQQGMSYVQLYYNKGCTRELEKDINGNYIYNSTNISNNAIMPLIINLWCKNNGSHTAYDVRLDLITSDIAVTVPEQIDKLYSMQVDKFPIQINIPKGDSTKHDIILRTSYDSI